MVTGPSRNVIWYVPVQTSPMMSGITAQTSHPGHPGHAGMQGMPMQMGQMSMPMTRMPAPAGAMLMPGPQHLEREREIDR